MSYTELHTGRLHCSQYVNEEFIKENLSESEGYEYNYRDGLGEWGSVDFIEKDSKLTHIYHRPTRALYEVLNHKSKEANDYLSNFNKNLGGDIDFTVMFYNGGTCFTEMLEQGLEEVLNENNR